MVNTPPPPIRLKDLYNQTIENLDMLNQDIAKIEIKESFSDTCKKSQHLIDEMKGEFLKVASESQDEEWDTFTIALYGETNAGKSTLIEGLRILFEGEMDRDISNCLDMPSPSQDLKTMMADGEIIGDGRSDFTRKVQTCHFSRNGQNFALLDVPGIEGKEVEVIKEIERATKKAHAVFYITAESNPPQSGTLEKIKNHLGAQTEVYAIFNKPINSLEQIENLTEFVAENEKEGLEELDQKMKDALGNHYAGCHTLSAKIGFLAIAKNPTPELEKEQKKFLKEFSREELLEKSQLKHFANFLETQLVVDTQKKIEASNTNKARVILEKCQKTLEDISDHFCSICEKSLKEYLEVEGALQGVLAVSKSKIERNFNNALDKTFNSIRATLYGKIEIEIENSDLQNYFNNVVERQLQELNNVMRDSLQDPIKELEFDIEKIMKRSIKKTNQAIRQSEESQLRAYANLSVESEFNTAALLSGLGGGAAAVFTAINFWNPIGWTIAGFTALASLASFFGLTSDLKSKQREAIDKELRRIKNQIKGDIQTAKEQVFEKLEMLIDHCKLEAEQPSNHFRDLTKCVDASIREIEALEKRYLISRRQNENA